MTNTSKLPKDWHVYEDAELLAQALTQQILTEAENAIKKTGAFHFITAGGSTPNRCYELLSAAQADWQNWHIYMGDERVLPFLNAERNSQALLNHWLSNNDIPVKQIHFINTEAGLQKSAEYYAELIESVASFDLCLLGMGEDGHTASLFPGHETGESVSVIGEQKLVITETNSPKPPAQRVSLNYSAFTKVNTVIKVVTGASKVEAIQQWLEGEPLPIAKVSGQTTSIWVSKDALP